MSLDAALAIAGAVVVIAMPIALAFGPGIALAVRERRTHALAMAAEQRRVDGLPEHERCPCGACAAWRRQEFGA